MGSEVISLESDFCTESDEIWEDLGTEFAIRQGVRYTPTGLLQLQYNTINQLPFTYVSLQKLSSTSLFPMLTFVHCSSLSACKSFNIVEAISTPLLRITQLGDTTFEYTCTSVIHTGASRPLKERHGLLDKWMNAAKGRQLSGNLSRSKRKPTAQEKAKEPGHTPTFHIPMMLTAMSPKTFHPCPRNILSRL